MTKKLFMCGLLSLSLALPFSAYAEASDTVSDKSDTESISNIAFNSSSSSSNTKLPLMQRITPYGFIRNYFCYDSRDSYYGSEGLFYIMPKDENLDKNGKDLNAFGSMRFLSITTRLGFKVDLDKVWGADASAVIEADFKGGSSIPYVLRLRKAYFNLKWEHNNILAGKTWHPMSSCLVPDVLSLNTGAPYNPFSRTAQITWTGKYGKFSPIAGLMFQSQFNSPGPDGISSSYARKSCVPELFASANMHLENFTFGAGVDILTVKPHDVTPLGTKSNDKLTTPTFFGYFNYVTGKFTFKAKYLYGLNTAHLFGISGYAQTYDTTNDSYSYYGLAQHTSWESVTYKFNKNWRASLFFGAMKNSGCPKDNAFISSPDDIFVRGYKNVDSMYRITPNILYTNGSLNLGLEYQATTVNYGDIYSNCTVKNTHSVLNNGITVLMKYNF